MLSDRSAGLLSPRQERWLSQHLAGCPECRREEEVLARVLMLVDRVPLLLPPRDLWCRVEAQIRRDPAVSIAPLPLRWRPVGAAVFAGTALALAAATYFHPAPETSLTLTTLPPESISYIETHALHARTGPLADDIGLISFATVAGRRRPEGVSGW